MNGKAEQPEFAQQEGSRWPFVDHSPIDKRGIYPRAYYNEEDDRVCINVWLVRDRTLIHLPDDYIGPFWAKAPIDKSIDLYFPLLQMIAQHYSYKYVVERHYVHLQGDIVNLAAILRKHFVLLDYFRRNEAYETCVLVSTELEFLFTVVRSMFDHMIGIFCELRRINGKDHPKESFNKMFNKSNGQLKNIDERKAPKSFLDFCENWRPFFLSTTNIRDNVIHRGQSLEWITCRQDGFAVRCDEHPYNGLSICQSDNVKNDTVSVLAIMAWAMKQVFEAMADFANALERSVPHGQAISDNWHVYLRTGLDCELKKLDEYLRQQWYPPSKSPDQALRSARSPPPRSQSARACRDRLVGTNCVQSRAAREPPLRYISILTRAGLKTTPLRAKLQTVNCQL